MDNNCDGIIDDPLVARIAGFKGGRLKRVRKINVEQKEDNGTDD